MTASLRLSTIQSPVGPRACPQLHRRRCQRIVPRAESDGNFTVEIDHQNQTHSLSVGADQTILEVALEQGLDLPHDCKLGVCMTCPARLVSGEVDQSGSMLSEDVAAQGYALLCSSHPRTDCKIKTIDEEELLQLQLKTSEY